MQAKRGAKMLSGASFCELCALELKWPPLCRDTVHYLKQDCIKRGQLSGTPAARTNTQSDTDAEQKHTMENATESKTAEAKGFPQQCAKQINRAHTHTHTTQAPAS